MTKYLDYAKGIGADDFVMAWANGTYSRSRKSARL